MKRGYLVLAFLIFAIPFQLIAQDSLRATSVTPEAEPTFYEWEAGVDLLPLIDKSNDAFGFIVKHNFRTTSSSDRSALRLKFRPQLGRTSLQQTAQDRQSSIYLAIGYEKQKMYGHFSLLYGAEPFIQYSHNRIGSASAIRQVSEQTSIIVGVGGFVGGRYYIGKHLAATLESHLIYQNSSSKASTNGSRFSTRASQLFVEPIHTIYLSYHF